ncbi:MAG TPA: AI-2E family transporter [Gemmatimonadaceae bacterium]|nr:AI-2E family transporter [Gemmatimonadaceae bacterium]
MSELRGSLPGDRRRLERRATPRVLDLTLPEFRRIVLTSLFFAIVFVLFLWMVRTVVIAGILALIVATYTRPLHLAIRRHVRSDTVAALLTIVLVVVPILAVLVYSFVELQGAASYVSAHEGEIVRRIDAAVRRIPFLEGRSFTDQIRNGVLSASHYGATIVSGLREEMAEFTVSAAVFLFTSFYVLTDADSIAGYVRSKVPPRYGEMARALEVNVRGVLYGAIYATLLTQTIKSAIILAMNVAFGVPLAVVLAVLSFIIGFFPIVGSWSVYVPVAAWLLIFRDAWIPAILMLVIGFVGNTLIISMYVRPKIAAEKSRVLNFYWMFIGLVTGVYTFGLVGVLLGPIIIGILKATVDTVTAQASWRLLDADGEPEEIVKQV